MVDQLAKIRRVVIDDPAIRTRFDTLSDNPIGIVRWPNLPAGHVVGPVELDELQIPGIGDLEAKIATLRFGYSIECVASAPTNLPETSEFAVHPHLCWKPVRPWR